MNTFIAVNNITLTYVRNNLEDKSMLFHSRKGLLLPLVWPETEHIWALT